MTDDEWVAWNVLCRLNEARRKETDAVRDPTELLATIRKAAFELGDPEQEEGLKERAEDAQRTLFDAIWRDWAARSSGRSSRKIEKSSNPPKWLPGSWLTLDERDN